MDILIIVLVVAVFLALREFWTWFFKLNTITRQNEEIIRLLRKLANEPEPKSTTEKAGAKLGKMMK